jgi:CubicO group peptidase (beta-lactamase class C family)
MLLAVLQVLERLAKERRTTLGALLDADIDTLVRTGPDDRLSVRNPKHPEVPVTLRQVLTHTSSIHNRYDAIPHNYPVTPPDFAWGHVPPLHTVMTEYLRPGGRYFHLDNFRDEPPGTKYEYSSVANAIAALVVEAQAHEDFRLFTQRNVIDRLGLTDTAFRLADLPRVRRHERVLALPYTVKALRAGAHPDGDGGADAQAGDGGAGDPDLRVIGAIPVPVVPPHWEHVFYPAASLRSTVLDYGVLVGVFMGDGRLGDVEIVAPETMHEARRIQYPAISKVQGLVLYTTERDGIVTYGHSGANDGYLSTMAFMTRGEPSVGADGGARVERDLYGVVVLTNGDAEGEKRSVCTQIADELLHRARLGQFERR